LVNSSPNISKLKYPALPNKKFNIIYGDLPWPYRDKGVSGKRGASQQYTTIDLVDLINFPIEKIASKNCALFLWATDPMLPEALAVMRSWGFQFKRVAFVWVKTTLDGKKYKIGLGRWTRSNAEFVILGIRGHPRVVNHSISQIVAEPPRGHSIKPDEVRNRIVKLLGPISRIELFARSRKHLRDGWTYWGDQA